jgi:hypothetical protein
MLIVMASLMLAALARQSLMLALEAVQKQEELQARWGTISCQRAVLNRARTIFARQIAQAADNRVPPADVRRQLSSTFELGGIPFRVILSDEDAKLNVNTVYATYGEQRTERILRQLTASKGRLDVRLRRSSGDLADSPTHLFRAWGQVFDHERISPSADVASHLQAATTEVTLWGAGRLNVYRASDQAIEAVWHLAVGRGTPQELQKLRRRIPPRSLWEIVAGLQLRDHERHALERILTDRSHGYSLWVFGPGCPTQMSLINTEDNRAYTQTFIW